ncbi:MAG: Asp-tRNA(Asn)/Glu-tRNA(Gln) amidotransferase subunit GatC [Candidatus Spechtbacterales bacterium]
MSKKLTIEEVEHIAELAHIGISDEEKTKLQEDLGSVLDYVDKLQEVDVSAVQPIFHITGLENQVREDENGSTHADPKTLIDMAPETKDGYVKVKQVLAR